MTVYRLFTLAEWWGALGVQESGGLGSVNEMLAVSARIVTARGVVDRIGRQERGGKKSRFRICSSSGKGSEELGYSATRVRRDAASGACVR